MPVCLDGTDGRNVELVTFDRETSRPDAVRKVALVHGSWFLVALKEGSEEVRHDPLRLGYNYVIGDV